MLYNLHSIWEAQSCAHAEYAAASLAAAQLQRDFPRSYRVASRGYLSCRTCTCTYTNHGGSSLGYLREATNGESSSNSVCTPECAKLHLRASIFPKCFWGGMPPDPPREAANAAGRFTSGGLRTPRTSLFEILDPPLLSVRLAKDLGMQQVLRLLPPMHALYHDACHVTSHTRLSTVFRVAAEKAGKPGDEATLVAHPSQDT